MTNIPSLISGKIARGEEGRCAGMEGDLVPLEQFDYGNKKLGCLLQESMDEVFFLGVTVSHATVSHEGMIVWLLSEMKTNRTAY